MAKAEGYRKHGTRYWRSAGDLTTLLAPQRSRWDASSLYMNFGATPSFMIVRAYPPPLGLWPISLRAERVSESTVHHDVFCSLATGELGRVNSENMTYALGWLFDWVDSNLAAQSVKRVIREGDSTSTLASVWNLPTERVMYDWAFERSKTPKEYYSSPFGGRYYASCE